MIHETYTIKIMQKDLFHTTLLFIFLTIITYIFSRSFFDFWFLFFLCISAICMVLLIISRNKNSLKPMTTRKKQWIKYDSEKNVIDLINSIERPVLSKKNKWLYPTDEFGKMEKGVVEHKSKETYKKGKKGKKNNFRD